MSEILSSVLLLGIFVIAVGVAMIWATPLIEKGSDKVKLELAVADAKRVGTALIEMGIGGGKGIVELKSDPIVQVNNDSIELIVETNLMLFPTEYVPIYGGYPWVSDSFYIESTFQNTTYANATFDAYGNTYLLELYNTSGVFDRCCLNDSTTEECGSEGDYVLGFKIVEIDDNGGYTFLEGKKNLSVATFGVDEPYSILARSKAFMSTFRTSLLIVPKRIYRTDEMTVHILCGKCYGKGDLMIEAINSTSKDIYIRVDIV